MRRVPASALLAVLAGCGGITADPVTIADLVPYLAQSRTANGDAATPLMAGDPMTYRRYDFGREQITDSFLTGPASAITAWSYDPWSAFSLDARGYGAHGDGGEKYIIQGDRALITDTQDGGKPGVQHFLIPWTVATRQTIDCSKGWTTYSGLSRGCRTTVDYPGIGPVDTIVSEHGDKTAVERIFLARGWGRLAWQAFSRLSPREVERRCPDFGWSAPVGGLPLSDCRIAVNVEPASEPLRGVDLWKP